MAERIEFKVVTNVATNGRKAEIIGHAEDGPASVLLPAEALPSIMASLSAIEEELNAGTTYYSRPVFHYQGFEIRVPEDQSEVGLLIRCHPDMQFGFVMSATDMKELGRNCLEQAERMKPKPDRPN